MAIPHFRALKAQLRFRASKNTSQRERREQAVSTQKISTSSRAQQEVRFEK
jgi:hypothetical protein